MLPWLINFSCALLHFTFLFLCISISKSVHFISHSPSLHHTPYAFSCLAFHLTTHFPCSILSPIAPCLQWKGWGLEGWGGETEESRQESISRLRHQCFAVGTLLITLLHNYSTSIPSLWLLHQSCFLFLSLSPALYPLFACFFFFNRSICAVLFPIAYRTYACQPITNWVTHNLFIDDVQTIDIHISRMLCHHILHKKKIWLTLCVPLVDTCTHTRNLYTLPSTCCLRVHPHYASHVP